MIFTCSISLKICYFAEFDEHYHSYLVGMSIPSFAVDMILTFNDLYEFSVPQNKLNETWFWKEDSVNGKNEYHFNLGEEFQVIFGVRKKFKLSKKCELSEGLLQCNMISNEKGWNITEKINFRGEEGLIQSLTLHGAGQDGSDITTLREFKKTSKEDIKKYAKQIICS